MNDVHQKVGSRHLARNAYLYVRQSTLRQVFENTESTKRQYDLKQRALALGWPAERVVVIDSDLGQSGASSTDREGFQMLVTEVGLGRAGIVMGLEVSRLARNSSDWHRLLEICALTDTLILDEDGIYDPAHFNDRLLLGLKGTMSEAELHVLKARLQGGIINKARRGELRSKLPIGFIYDTEGRVVLHPDRQVRDAIQMLFRTFRRVGSATATVKAFREKGLRFPRKARTGPSKGEILWAELDHSLVLHVLHNPRYAGVFFYGRMRQRKLPDVTGQRYRLLPREEWTAFVPGAHPGYIPIEEFEENQRRLTENARAHGDDRKRSPPREGPALLQGLVVCGVCGKRMTVRYERNRGQLQPVYMCQREGIRKGTPSCQCVPGASIDEAIGTLLIEAVSPMALEVTLAVQEEIQARLDEADRLRSQQVERARYETELARRRYLQVDPDNRLVADELEADWNRKLRTQREAEAEYEREREADRVIPNKKEHARILELAADIPRLWNDPKTPARERKRMVRLLLEDVTLRKEEAIAVKVRFRGGALRTFTLPRPIPAWQRRQTHPEVIAEIDRLLDNYTDAQIAAKLNAAGHRSGEGLSFDRLMVRRLRMDYELKPRYDRLREAGMLTQEEVAQELDVSRCTVKTWRRRGLLQAHAYNDRNDYLYEPLGDDRPQKYKWKCRPNRAAARKPATQRRE